MSYKDDVLEILDSQVLELLTKASSLRDRYYRDRDIDSLEVAQCRRALLEAAWDLEKSAVAIAAEAKCYELISYGEYRVIRNIIDHIDSGLKMEDLVW